MMASVYIDESGQTGPDFLSESEKYFILAGWLDKNEILNRKENKIELMKLLGDAEIKSNKLLSTKHGTEKVLQVYDFMISKQCEPFLAVVNKRLCIPMRIVEVLMDPNYNSKIPKSFETQDFWSVKKEYVSNLYDLMNDVEIQQFAEIYRGKDMSFDKRVRAMKAYISDLSLSLLSKNKELAILIGEANNSIQENLEDEEEEKSKKMARQAPNTWLLYCLLLKIAQHAEHNNYRVNVFHDNQFSYQTSIEDMIQFIVQNPDLFEGNQKLDRINQIKFVDSKSNPCIQAADILAGAVNAVLKRKITDWDKTVFFKEVVQRVIPLLDVYKNNDRTHFIDVEKNYNDILQFYKR